MSGGRGLLALALGTFALGIAEFSMMGILTTIARELYVSIPDAGDFISAYALGVCIGAPLPLLFRRRPLKSILIGLALLIALGNIGAALAQGYWTLAMARLVSGLPHGAYFGVAAIVATNLAPAGRKATAVAIMVAGMTMANLIGVPMATWLANAVSWRLVFTMAAAAGLLAGLGIWFEVPKDQPALPKKLARAFAFLRGAAPWLIFAATFLGQGSVYCWYSYMEPIMRDVAGVPADGMKWVMVAAGLGMLLGGLGGGKLADRFHPALVTCVTAITIVPILLAIYFCSHIAWLAILLTFLGAGSLFALGGPMQYLIVRFSRGGEILGGAGIQIAFNGSNALSAFLGGMAINAGFGFAAPALLGIPMAIAAAVIMAWFYERYHAINLNA